MSSTQIGLFKELGMNDEVNLCGDCGVEEGQIHRDGCDMERCFLCGGQLISCDCDAGEKLENRVPYIAWPNLCAYCGQLWPDFFSVSDEEWAKYIQLGERDKMVCKPCYDKIKRMIDEGSLKPEERLRLEQLRRRVVESNNIVDVIGEYVQLKPKDREFIGLCPFHNYPDPTLNVNPEKQIFKCFGCGAGGDVVDFVSMVKKITVKDALHYLAGEK